MSTKLTKIQGDDGEDIYIQYDDEEADELQAVGYIDDIQERTEKMKKAMLSTVRGYSRLVLDSVKQGMTDKLAPTKVIMEYLDLNDSDSGVRYCAAEALGKIGNPIAVEGLIAALNHSDFDVSRNPAEALTKIGNPETLDKIIQSPEINIYDKDILLLARTLTLRFSKKPPRNKKGQPLIPVYPELVRFKQAWLFVKRHIFK